jgi:hypothetical protein
VTVNTLLIIVLCLANIIAVAVIATGDVHFIRNNPPYRNRTTYLMLAASYLIWQLIAGSVIAYVFLTASKHWWGIQILETAILSYFAVKVIVFLCEVLDFQTKQSPIYRL